MTHRLNECVNKWRKNSIEWQIFTFDLQRQTFNFIRVLHAKETKSCRFCRGFCWPSSNMNCIPSLFFTTQLLCRFCTIFLHICMKIMQLPFVCSRSRSKYFKFIYLRSTFEHQNETNCSDVLNQQILANFAKQSNWTARLRYFFCLFVDVVSL